MWRIGRRCSLDFGFTNQFSNLSTFHQAACSWLFGLRRRGSRQNAACSPWPWPGVRNLQPHQPIICPRSVMTAVGGRWRARGTTLRPLPTQPRTLEVRSTRPGWATHHREHLPMCPPAGGPSPGLLSHPPWPGVLLPRPQAARTKGSPPSPGTSRSSVPSLLIPNHHSAAQTQTGTPAPRRPTGSSSPRAGRGEDAVERGLTPSSSVSARRLASLHTGHLSCPAGPPHWSGSAPLLASSACPGQPPFPLRPRSPPVPCLSRPLSFHTAGHIPTATLHMGLRAALPDWSG